MPKKLKKRNEKQLVDIGVNNIKNWIFLKEKLNFQNDNDFVEYLLSVAEKYLCSKLIRFDRKSKLSNDSSDEDKDTVEEAPKKSVIIQNKCDSKKNRKIKIKNTNKEAKILDNSDVEVDDPKEVTNLELCRFCDLKHSADKCPLERPLTVVEDEVVYDELTGDDFAKATLPKNLAFKEVEGGNLGIFTVVQISKYTQFGPLVGSKIKEMEIADDYSMKDIWEISQNCYLSTKTPEKSNWLRWLRPAPTRSKRNIIPIEKNGQLFFITLAAVPPDVELFFWAEMTGSWASKKMEKTNCGGCNLQFDHAMYYRMHCAVFHEASLSLTVRKYHCKVCGKAVLGKQNIMKHALLYHEGKGAYQCQFCSKFFLRLNYLEMHRNYGCSANPHRARPLCDYCGRKFCQPQKLKVHIKRMHSDLSEVLREFQCPDCLKVLGSRAALQRHTKEVHKRPSGVSCARCSKTFQNKSNLKIHMLTHSGVKPFKCQEDKCSAAFTTKQCLQFHYKKVHGLTEDRFPRIVRSVEYTFESYAGAKEDEDSNREDSQSSEASIPKNVPEPTYEETSVIEYHQSSKESTKCIEYAEPEIYRKPESSTNIIEEAPENDLRPIERQSPEYTSPVYPSPRYERYSTPPHEFIHEDPRFREEEVQNLSKYKYEDDRDVYHGFMPRYSMYDYPPEVIRAMNIQSVDLSMSRTQIIQPLVTHLDDRIVSPPYQTFSQPYLPQKSPPYHHYSGYY